MKAFAIHQIQRGLKSDPRVIPAGGVFETSGAEQKRLEDMGAIREATKDEVTLAKANSGLAESTTVTATKATAEQELAAARADYLALFGEEAPAKAKIETINQKIAERRELDTARARYKDVIKEDAPADMSLADLKAKIAEKDTDLNI